MNGVLSKLNQNESETIPNHLGIDINVLYPVDTVPYENQVAGHSSANGKSTIGMLKHKEGYVMKPMLKPAHAEREKKFYNDLQQALDSESLELKSFVPEFLGTNTLQIDNKDVEFLILKNVTSDFVEPCVMDIKIGKQTWDPEASVEKRQQEENKYTESKRDLGFCIPGFQVYDISSGTLIKKEKDYGQRLSKETTKDALKLFLNSDSGLSRGLLLQLLAHLWRMLRWCRSQHTYHLYSSSLLLVYDAKRLRHHLKTESSPLGRPPNLQISATSFVGQLSPSQQSPSDKHPLSRTPSTSRGSSPATPSTPTSTLQKQTSLVRSDSWHATLESVSRIHSFTHNYEKDLQDVKDNYSYQLDDLISKPGEKEVWATVKMIDFAHAFPAPSDEVDMNYLEGIENLVSMIESLMEEATCL